MRGSKRQFKRFDLVRDVNFRPTYGATEYFPGATRNISCDGLALQAHDFRFIMYENLDIMVSLPERGASVSLSGDIMWKRQEGDRCLAGIKFRMKDKVMKEAAVRMICNLSHIPETDRYGSDVEFDIHRRTVTNSSPDRRNSDNGAGDPPYKLGFIKKYNKNGETCHVTFRLLKEVAKNPQHVVIVGDFNGWDISKSPMTRLACGDFVVTLELQGNREFRFRYLIDGHRWEVDWHADKFVRNNEGFKDSVVIV